MDPSCVRLVRLLLVAIHLRVGCGTRLSGRARPVPPGGAYPARHLCSRCGVCDSSFIASVAEACPFIGEGMARIPRLERAAHGRSRDLDDEAEVYLGVTHSAHTVRVRRALEGAAWRGLVTNIAMAALADGTVDAVLAVGAKGTGPFERMHPSPKLCRTVDDVRACAGVKPVLANSLHLLDAVRADPSIRRLLFIGVGCQVQALRAVEEDLGLEALYVVGTNCADNVRSPEALETFLRAVSPTPETAVGFEFVADYAVHVRHVSPPDRYDVAPVFSLPSGQLTDVIAHSCYSCFDYTNACADMVIGYMGAPAYPYGQRMSTQNQTVVVRNGRGLQLLEKVMSAVDVSPLDSSGDRLPFTKGIVEQDVAGLFGTQAPLVGLPRWAGVILARALGWLGPRGLEFAKSSIDYHTLRNLVYLRLLDGDAKAAMHTPAHAQRIDDLYPNLVDDLVETYRTAAARENVIPRRRAARRPGQVPPPIRRPREEH